MFAYVKTLLKLHLLYYVLQGKLNKSKGVKP
jgi:hypothetical protein